MKDGTGASLYSMIAEVRTCFNLLKSLSEQIVQEFPVNPSMRAVMETLALKGPITVPDIAALKGVSRQHIQVNINALKKLALVREIANPAHKRSTLFELTENGQAVFSAITAKEARPLDTLTEGLSTDQIEIARAALRQLNRNLTHELRKGQHDAL